MDASDVRYIVEQAATDLRIELENEIDMLRNEVAKLHVRIAELEGNLP
jgi:F0F1-type ATP synthase membrane subunit b/b'